jgi:predicted RNA polymerase sigma factor
MTPLVDYRLARFSFGSGRCSVVIYVTVAEPPVPAHAGEHPEEYDETLTLLFMCYHPALSAASQVALTLRAVGGLRTDEIARAILVPEATMVQRISRAKRSIKSSGVPFRLPPKLERAERLRVVLHVLYLVFNEGYTATTGPGSPATSAAICPTTARSRDCSR